MSLLTVLAAIGIIVFVIGQQVVGGPVSGKRLIALPAVLTVIGIVDISGGKSHPHATDIVLLVVSAAIAIAIGVGLGAMTRLERRDGYLWAQLPKRGLPFLVSATWIGYEQHAYVWAGFGVWTQLWASITLPLAWGLSWRAIRQGRGYLAAVVAVAVTTALHYETG